MVQEKFAASPDERQEWLAQLAKIRVTWPDNDEPSLVLGTAEYVLLHYNLVDKRPPEATKAGDIIREYAETNGFRIDGSVWVIPQPQDRDAAIDFATEVWNAVAERTAGKLIEGDAIYVHFSGLRIDRIGFAAQVVPAGATALNRVVVVDPKAAK